MLHAEATMQGMDAIVDWAENQKLDHEVTRCKVDGWGVNIRLRDSNGPFYAFVRPVTSRKRDGSSDDFRSRVQSLASNELRKAREKRMRAFRGKMKRAA